MVCDKCEKKLTKIVGVDPYRNKAHNKPVGIVKKPAMTKNTLFTSDKKAAGVVGVQCRICKCRIHQAGSHYCQTCAYQKGICAMCGKKVVNVSGLRQSVV